jgi:hypothetical protein
MTPPKGLFEYIIGASIVILMDVFLCIGRLR